MPFRNLDFKKPEFEKVSDVVWEIPKDFKSGMLVPVRIYAKRNLLDAMDLEVFDQASNSAMLPGLLKYSYVFSDGHSGYGVPVGWCGAFDLKEGIISPGAIGFDINCLPSDSRISLPFGTWKKISDIEKNWDDEEVVFFDAEKKLVKSSNVVMFMKRFENEKLIELVTESGREIRVTEDHPLLSGGKMVQAKNLKKGDELYIRSFSGVEFENPSDELIVSEKDICRVLDELQIPTAGNSRIQIMNLLRKLGLNEVRYSSPKLPVILKLMGFIFGDGCISFTKRKRKGIISFYGKAEDLELIRKDIESLGFRAQNIYTRKRRHKINTYYGISKFSFTEHSLLKASTSLAAFLVTLGTPFGVKTSSPYRVPKWVMKSPLWQKRLFLASFFGAELSSPKTVNKYNFVMPQINMNKMESLKENAVEFLNDIRMLLFEFGVKSTYPVVVEGNQYFGKHGKTIGVRLLINSDPQNLINLWESIACEYNKSKFNLSSLATNYIRIKEKIKSERQKARILALEMYKSGKSPYEIREILRKSYVSEHFINHSIWPDRSEDVRVPPDFFSFGEYKKNLVGDGIVFDKIEKITSLHYKGYVYDFTMNDKNHNFFADNVVVSNCGMRLIRTNLTLDEVKPKIKELIDMLFKMVPAGVGASAYQEPKEIAKIPEGTFREIVESGVKWSVENGYAWKQDLERIEEYGGVKTADFSKVSKDAYRRGKSQIGTLGSGNHYLEIQVIDKIFDEKIARQWGLGVVPNQVCIMIHCGSRGFGHQICTDYLTTFVGAMRKYGIKVPDDQLASAPFGSEEGQDYLKAMSCAINYAFTNRQLIVYQIRKAFEKVFKKSAEELGLEIIYDVAHNTAKIEEHRLNGKLEKVIVHRKGATRSFGPGHPELAPMFKDAGQPVIVGGSMETGSFLCVGTEKSEEETFGTTLHGSGRTMSRTKARRMVRGEQLQKDLLERGIYIKATTMSGLAEEAGFAYKDINEVVDSMHQAGISLKVLRLRPIANIKG